MSQVHKTQSILVVGSLAYDSIQTPAGKAEKTLGGSANYFSLAASMSAQVRLVGVVGEDYSEGDQQLLLKRNVDLAGLQKVPGKTFHWEGSYNDNLNEAQTLKTELNVFEHFNPQLPAHYQDSDFVFLANIAPGLQLKVLEQVQQPILIGLDTMNFWIASQKETLLKVIPKTDIVLINEGEARLLTGKSNAVAAAPEIAKLGAKFVVVKRGEYGFVLFNADHGYHILPAFPIPEVVDPTGAGDTFAGGFFGYLAKNVTREGAKNTTGLWSHLQKACVQGSLLASYTIQDFGVKALAKVQPEALESRSQQYHKVIGR
ncbi:MAG: PfkB family carbohydrate kinase [Pseudobdellovibrionaceae bacterium]